LVNKHLLFKRMYNITRHSKQITLNDVPIGWQKKVLKCYF
jgi:hypothetical protein